MPPLSERRHGRRTPHSSSTPARSTKSASSSPTPRSCSASKATTAKSSSPANAASASTSSPQARSSQAQSASSPPPASTSCSRRGRTATNITSFRCRGASTTSSRALRGQVVLHADLLEQRELRFDPVDVLLLVLEDLFEEMACVVVVQLVRRDDVLVQARHRVHLQREIELELLRDVLADVDLAEALHVGDAVEEEDPLDDLLGVLHLADGMLADDVLEALVAPVLAHLAVHEILVDGSELRRQDIVEDVDDLLVALHAGEGTTAGAWTGQQAAAAVMASRSTAATASIFRSALWQEPHWSPMPHRCRSRTERAPPSMAWWMVRSEAPRQMQTIMVRC